ncbi:hypothetical protein ACFWA9_04275 [Kitasatospora sp. NPDC059973]|uniref:hypothetical protein n=1 Tax=Kitasatospora sp. NPDC059973 TaxID=3347020 RepID=UPI00367FEACC
MPIAWNDVLSTTGTVASACAAGFALLSARKANQTAKAAQETAQTVATIEAHRWHADLTPCLTVTFADRFGLQGLRISLDGPAGLDRLDYISVTMENETGVDRTGHASLGGSIPLEELETIVWSPFRFRPYVDGTDEHGRSPAPFSLRLGEWRPFAIEIPPAPRQWDSQRGWEALFDGKPIRLLFECRREGHEPWTIPYEIPSSVWNARAAPDTTAGQPDAPPGPVVGTPS